jgi:hypothetical protein
MRHEAQQIDQVHRDDRNNRGNPSPRQTWRRWRWRPGTRPGQCRQRRCRHGGISDVGSAARDLGRVNSQGPAHANVNGLVNASPNSVLGEAGVTTLTGLTTGLTVNNSAGTSIGTVTEVLTNRSGAVVGVRVDLTGDGGIVFIPATTLTMDGTIVTTTQTGL